MDASASLSESWERSICSIDFAAENGGGVRGASPVPDVRRRLDGGAPVGVPLVIEGVEP